MMTSNSEVCVMYCDCLLLSDASYSGPNIKIKLQKRLPD